MKRRTFLKNSVLGSLAFAFVPLVPVAEASTTQPVIFDLPQATPHIRHGLFQQNLVNLPIEAYQIQRDVFQNTLEGDLEHLSIRIKEELISVGIQDDLVLVNSNKGGLEMDLTQQDSFTFVINKMLKGWLLKAEEGQQLTFDELEKEALILPIRGTLTIHGKELTKEKGLWVPQTKDIEVQLEKTTILLILIKTD